MSSLTIDQAAKLKAEIVNDPVGRGYAAAADDTARATLFNEAYTVTQTNTITNNARITVFWHGVPSMPNAVTAQQVTNALGGLADAAIPQPAQLLLAAEINNDPAGRGYAGKTAQAQADLINNPYTTTQTITVTMPSRISLTLPESYAPTAITAADVLTYAGV